MKGGYERTRSDDYYVTHGKGQDRNPSLLVAQINRRQIGPARAGKDGAYARR